MNSSTLSPKGKPNQNKNSNFMNLKREPFCFDGPTPGEVKESIKHTLPILCRTKDYNFSPEEINTLQSCLFSFVDGFYKVFENETITALEIKSLSEANKDRKSDYSAFVSMMLGKDPLGSDLTSIFILSHPDKKDREMGYDFHECCYTNDFYVPSKLSGFVPIDLDEESDPQVIMLTKKPRYFIHLYRYTNAVVRFLERHGVSQGLERNPYVVSLMTYSISICQLYEKFNPSQEIKEEVYVHNDKGEGIFDILTSAEVVPQQWTLDLLDSVIQDMKLDKRQKVLPYVNEFVSAYWKWNQQVNWDYTDRDYYTGLRSTPSTISLAEGTEGKNPKIKKKYPSILASSFEVDTFKDQPEVKRFDAFSKYQSTYSDFPRGENPFTHLVPTHNRVVTQYPTASIVINNPSKYKPRTIHYSENAIQDRNRYIHNRLADFLDLLPSDCSTRQINGVRRAIQWTSPSYRMLHKNNVCNADFSEMTDRLPQLFQYRCLSIIFPKEICDYWQFISKSKKFFLRYLPDPEDPSKMKLQWVEYEQSNGQPQGMLGSFPAFTLAHHLLMLMAMKKTGMEKIPASDAYAVLGDDSIHNSVVEDKNNLFFENYILIAKAIGLKVNESKSNISIYGTSSQHNPVDFAKITVKDGNFISPLPAGLATDNFQHYRRRRKTYHGLLSMLLWYASKDVYLTEWLHPILWEVAGHDIGEYTMYLILFKCGAFEYLDGFKDPNFMGQIDPSLTGSLLYCQCMIKLKSTLLSFMFDDVSRQNGLAILDDPNEYINSLVDPEDAFISQMVNSVPPNHKLEDLVLYNDELIHQLKELYGTDNDLAVEMISIVLMNKEDRDLTDDIKWINAISELFSVKFNDYDSEMDAWNAFYHLDMVNLAKDTMSVLNSFQIRSSRAREKTKSEVFQGVHKAFLNKFGLSKIALVSLREACNIVQEMNYIPGVLQQSH